MANTYQEQRKRVTPPHVSLGTLRVALGKADPGNWTLDAVCERYQEATGDTLTRGGLSAIENGHRGASAQVLHGLSIVFGIEPEQVTTTYVPREWIGSAA